MNHPDRRSRPIAWAGLLVLVASTALAAPPPPFDLKDGDRVVFLGGTFIEREQSYGYLETLLTSRFPDRNITFRNLGWSGDTVWGEARARFGPPAEGFAHLKGHVEDLKPTVIFVNYGLNESFAGKAGLPEFERGLNTLLDVLDRTGARVVLITPRRLEKLAPPLPDPTKANERLGEYVNVLKRASAKRAYRLVDLFDNWKPDSQHPITDNGIHLTARGYRNAATEIGRSLGLVSEPPQIRLNFDGREVEVTGGKLVVKPAKDKLSLRFTIDHLPAPFLSDQEGPIDPANPPPPPNESLAEALNFEIELMDAGTYRMKTDGKDDGVPGLVFGSKRNGLGKNRSFDYARITSPDTDQAEVLQQAIIAKNELYFHRWRPQNETYLFGFRKHEQGNNAVEIPKFDPLVAAKEVEIARLRVPVPHTYEIIRKAEGP